MNLNSTGSPSSMTTQSHTDEWIDVAHSFTESEFVARYPGCFLISSDDATELSSMHDTRLADLTVTLSQTRHVRRLQVWWIAIDSQQRERVTVGRARDCDIAFPTSALSKVHAQFERYGQMLTVVDVGSKNGTQVNGKLLVPHRPEPVSAHDRIQFATVQTMLLEGRELREILARLH